MISVNRTLTRETSFTDYRTGRHLVMQLVEGGKIVRIKPKGARRWYTVTIQQIYHQGGLNAAADIRAERAAKKAMRKQLRFS